MMRHFWLLYIFLIILCFCKQSLSPTDWASIERTDASGDIFSLSPTFNLPSSLLKNGTIPIVGYYANEIHIIDTFNNLTYYTDTQETNDIWHIATINKIPLTPSLLMQNLPPIYLPNNSFPNIISYFDGACSTFKCYTQIDEYLYILYDFTSYILIYDLHKKEFLTEQIPFEYAGYYCLTNNGTHIFGIGDFVNILILSVSELDLSIINIQYSSDYIANDDDLPSTCSMDNTNENIYIFNYFGVIKYSIPNDILSVIYDRDYYLPYNQSNGSLISANANDENIIFIQSQDQNIYPLSTVTNKFLNCRVDGTSISNPHFLDSLIFIENNLFKMGGIDLDNSIATFQNNSDIYLYWDAAFIDSISLIESQFADNRFIITDWYHPAYPLNIYYTDGIADLGNLTDGFVQIDLTSLDFDVEHIYIDIHSKTSADTDDECRPCYDGILGAVHCSGTTGYCLSDGLITDLWAIEELIPLVNQDELIDIQSLSYSIEVASTTSSVPSSKDPAFICNSFPIYPVYLSINVSLFAHPVDDKYYFNIEYEYKCNGCSVTDFNDELYAFSSSVVIESESMGVSGITMDILNQKSCTIVDMDDTGIEYGCHNYSLNTLSELYFDGEYSLSLSSSDTFLENNEILLILSPEETLCRVGSGYSSDTNSCHLCLDGTFSMQSDLRACISCSGLDGVSCDGSNSVIVAFRYWLAGYRQSTDEYITLFKMNNNSFSDSHVNNDDILISHICGYGQCCDQINGCDYSQYFYKEALCSNNRDITSAMCTACVVDTYELLSTNDCGDCDYYDNMYYLIGIFSIAFLLVLYLSFCDAKPLDIMLHTIRHRNDPYHTQQQAEQEYEDDDDASDSYADSDDTKKGKNKRVQEAKEKEDETEMQFSYFVADSYVSNSVLIFQIFVYYFQGYAEILNSSGSRAYLSPVINFFNFNFADDQVGSNGNDDTAGFCAIPYTSALNEIFMILIFPFLMLFSLFLIYSFCHQGRCCRGNKYCTKPYAAIAFYRIGIIIVGLIFRVIMQLITCTRFVNDGEEKWVQFYYNQECFGASWSVSLVTLIILLLYFASIYKKLYQQRDEDRHSTMNKYNKLVQGYKNKYWYWEAVITLRRFIITMFVTLSFIGGGYSNLILCLILIFFLIAHLSIYPFQHVRNNRIEAFCILAILIGFIGINFDDIANSLFLSLFLGIVIFMPIIIALYYFIKLCCHCYQYVDGNEQYYIDSYSKQQPNDKLESMMTRVLHKRPSYFENKKDEQIDVLKVQPYTTPGQYNIEMAKLSHSANTQDGNHSDSSCGLTAH